jgi:NADPH:quinone reductase-like Zn-dependent oxidoreductase
MHAYVFPGLGENSSEIEIDKPVPGAGEVLVRVYASGVNPLDTKIRAGRAEHAKQPLPAVLGMDMAGIVEAVGKGVTGFKAGDEVFGMVGGVGGRQGTLAEYVAPNALLLALKPKTVTMCEAAAMPLAIITAWEGLIDRARIQAGQKVLVHGGAGGIGHIVVQLALTFGADVIATVSPGKEHIVRSLGATAINYRALTVERYVAACTAGRGFDVIFDTVGGATLDASFLAVKRYTGHVVSCLGWSTHSLAPLSFRGATYSGVFTLIPLLTGEGLERHGKILRQAARLMDAGKLRPILDERRFTGDDIDAAYALVESGANRGRIVIELNDAASRITSRL